MGMPLVDGGSLRARRVVRRFGIVGTLILLALSGPLVDAGVAVPFVGDPATQAPRDPGMLLALRAAPLAVVSDAPSDAPFPGSMLTGAPPAGTLTVLVTFRYSNESRLNATLVQISDPNSSHYHQYLSANSFSAEFAPPVGPYTEALHYFGSFDVTALTALPDRVSISFQASPAVAGAIFHTPLMGFQWENVRYSAPERAPELPAPIAAAVAGVIGLGSASWVGIEPGTSGVGSPAREAPSSGTPATGPFGLPSPAVHGATQFEYATDLQATYDELSLFSAAGYPTNATIATISWGGNYSGSPAVTPCGTLATGAELAPFSLSDVDEYFNGTLAAGEPDAAVHAVPIDGAVAPTAGCLASYDTSGAVLMNTADLEMIGSTAPGAQVYSVYGPGPIRADLDQAFGDILSPPASLGAAVVAALGNVTVISNPWWAPDGNDSAWYADLQQAQARGLTVLAASGDSSDNPRSPFFDRVGASFPASMAFNTFGDVAVGGTTVGLAPSTLDLSSDAAWNNSSASPNPVTGQAGPSGSAGGVSLVFNHTPLWQRNSLANPHGIDGSGRGVPDVSAMANNTLVTLTLRGVRYLATNASSGGNWTSVWGTGIAVSLVAGVVAEIDHVMLSYRQPRLGFCDPTLYALADLQFSSPPAGTVNGTVSNANYTSPLPALPFDDVRTGANDLYRAVAGYDLVTGWGSLDAYNLTMYVLNASSAGIPGRLTAVQDLLNLSSLAAHSLLPGGRTAPYNASIQQNLFLANGLGAPVYWVQSLIDLKVVAGGWAMNFTGWVHYPFMGIYPNLTVAHFWVPMQGATAPLPVAFDLITRLLPSRSWNGTVVRFTFGVAGSMAIQLSVPGAAFIIGASTYSYSWQGTEYTNGPGRLGSPSGYLAPQFGILGSAPNGAGTFGLGTLGSVNASVLASGAAQFTPAATVVLPRTSEQSAATAGDLSYVAAGTGNFTFGYAAGSTEGGIEEFEPEQYAVTFTQSTAPTGSTWYVNITNGPHLSAPASASSVSTSLANGSYTWGASVDNVGWASAPPTAPFAVNGTSLGIALTFRPLTDSVTFVASGPKFPFEWYVNITGGPSLSGPTSSLATSLAYGKWLYHVRSSNSLWAPTRYSGSFEVGRTPLTVEIFIEPETYPVVVIASLAARPIDWTVTIGNLTRSGITSTGFRFPLINGSYTYSIGGLPSGYSATPSHGTVTVKGPTKSLVIVISLPPSGAGGLFGLGIWGYGVVVAPVVAGVVGLLLVRRRRKRAAEQAAADGTTPPPPPRRVKRRRPPPPPPRRQRPRRSKYLEADEL